MSHLLILFSPPFSAHNWNTLFVGTSAVADAIAEKYNTTKSQVLDHVSHTALSNTPSKVLKAESNFSSIITSNPYAYVCQSLY